MFRYLIPREGTETYRRLASSSAFFPFRYLIPREGTETVLDIDVTTPGLLFRYLIPREGTETKSLTFISTALSVQIPYSPRGDGNVSARYFLSWAFRIVQIPYSPRGDGNVGHRTLYLIMVFVQIPYSPRGDGNRYPPAVKVIVPTVRIPYSPRGDENLPFVIVTNSFSCSDTLLPARGRKQP